MKHLRWLVTLPLAIVLAVFAINNRDTVNVSLWPLEYLLSLPLFALVLLAVVIGFLAGAVIAWLSASTSRRLSRQRRRRIEETEREIATLQRRIEAQESEAPTALPMPPPSPPARLD